MFAAYVVAGKLGLQLATVNASATAVWPPTGIAIAACLLVGYRIWPAIFAGAFVVNVTTAGSIVSSLGIATGNALEGVIGAYLVDRFANGHRAFLHVATVLRFALLAALIAPVASATIGVTSLALTGYAEWSAFAPVWFTWWVGDAGGALIAAPFIVLWATTVPHLRGGGDRSELIALTALTAATALVVFTPPSPLATERIPAAFLMFPVLVWVALRFGPRGATTVLAGLALVALYGAATGAGPFARPNSNESLLLLQSFMAVACVTSLALAAAVIERQQVEEALRATEERLLLAEEHKVAVRDEFLSVAAHELRTPLTGLHLAVQLLQREVKNERDIRAPAVAGALGHIASQTARLGKLVDQLLDTVRIETSRMDLAISEQDLVPIAERVVSEAQAMAVRHDIEMIAHGPVIAAVDPLRIEQVLRNLIDNAVKFSPPGTVIVDVSAEGGMAVVEVRDHGPGIAPQDREHVFDRYYRGENSFGGLGLGLHVSRQIVALHGGTISADFPADGGTRIVVRLPMSVAAAPELEEALR